MFDETFCRLLAPECSILEQLRVTFAEIFRCILTPFLLGHFLSYLTRGLAGECLLTFSQRAPSRLFPRCMSESSCTVVWLFCLFPADYLIELLLPLHLLSRSSFLLRLIAQLILVPSLLFPSLTPLSFPTPTGTAELFIRQTSGICQSTGQSWRDWFLWPTCVFRNHQLSVVLLPILPLLCHRSIQRLNLRVQTNGALSSLSSNRIYVGKAYSRPVFSAIIEETVLMDVCLFFKGKLFTFWWQAQYFIYALVFNYSMSIGFLEKITRVCLLLQATNFDFAD